MYIYIYIYIYVCSCMYACIHKHMCVYIYIICPCGRVVNAHIFAHETWHTEAILDPSLGQVLIEPVQAYPAVKYPTLTD